jgi:hypothetical protein
LKKTLFQLKYTFFQSGLFATVGIRLWPRPNTTAAAAAVGTGGGGSVWRL